MEATRSHVVKRFIDAMDSGDLPVIDELLDDEVTWELMGDLGICGEINGKRQLFERLVGPVSSRFEEGTVSYELIDLYEDPAQATVIAHWHESGDVKRGGRFENDIMAAFRVADGKIVAAKEFMDLRPVVETLGLT